MAQLTEKRCKPDQDVRIIASIAGRYRLIKCRDLEREPEIPCRAVNISTRRLVIAAPVAGEVGERVIADFDKIGELQGPISRVLDQGFVLEIMATDAERKQLAAKLRWLDRHRQLEVQDNRQYERSKPGNPHSSLILQDGRTLKCLVIDMSLSGAGVAAEFRPEIGTPLAVGKVVARVVRHFDRGFGVRFLEVQPVDRLEYRLIQDS